MSGARAVLYASGDESVAQLGLPARRLGLSAPELSLVNENDLWWTPYRPCSRATRAPFQVR
jgi:predicted ATP-dependent serine protease